MGKSVNPKERRLQKSATIAQRQLNFIFWAETNLPEFDWNKLVRDKMDEQIEIFNPDFLPEKDDNE